MAIFPDPGLLWWDREVGWRGLRWVGGFGGDEEYPSCGLGYVFVGLTTTAGT